MPSDPVVTMIAARCQECGEEMDYSPLGPLPVTASVSAIRRATSLRHALFCDGRVQVELARATAAEETTDA